MLNFKKVKIPTSIKVDSRFEKLPLKRLFVFSVFTNLVVLILSVLSTFFLPPEIPIFYGLPKTSQQIAGSPFIILPSLIAIVLTVINSIVSINLESQFLKRIMAFSSLLITILSLITTYKIIVLVGAI